MLDFFWPARSEHGLDAKPTTLMTPAASLLTQPPVPKQLKRKRDQNGFASIPRQSNSGSGVNHANSQNVMPADPVSYASSAATTHPKLVPSIGCKAGATDFHPNSAAAEALIQAPVSFEHDIAVPVATVPYHAAGQAVPPESLASSSPMSSTPDNVQALRDTIETQFNLEILIKNRELRLIEQELAKCQVAYDQIRRCQLIPFPSQSSHEHDMMAVSKGAGDSYDTGAPYAAPWGIVEGPYSRHYSSWLITDSNFDSAFAEEPRSQPLAGKRLPDRHTRGVHAEKGTFGVPPRFQRSSMSTRLTGHSNEQADHRLEKGPMIVARKSDGHMVKLVCLDCRRSDFNSVQGFINHCRIAHSRQFVSHEAAIEASGEEVDGNNLDAPSVEQTSLRQSSAASLVHPLIRAARPPTPAANSPLASQVAVDQAAAVNTKPIAPGKAQRSPKSPRPQTMPNFTPSPHTPFLSALLSKLGRGDNLADNVDDAKRTDEIDAMNRIASEESEGEDNEHVHDEALHSRSTRGVVQSSFRPVSSGGTRTMALPSVALQVKESTGQQPPSRVQNFERMKWSSPSVETRSLTYSNHDGPANDLASPSSNLSPGVTDPHPAPSLVSDDGDYDHIQSDSDLSSTADPEAEDDQYDHPQLFDDDAMDLDDHSPFNFTISEKAGTPRIGRRRRVSKIDRAIEDRQVTFVDQADGRGAGGINFITK